MDLSKDLIEVIAFEEIRYTIEKAYKNNTDRRYGTIAESDANQIVGIVNLTASLTDYISAKGENND